MDLERDQVQEQEQERQQPRASGPLATLFARYRGGQVSRRQFVTGATALGMSATAAAACANVVSARATPEGSPAATPGASPAASPVAASMPTATRPDSGTENQERGGGGDLRIIQHQAIAQLSPHTATALKDVLGATLILEPLMYFAPDSALIPNLITEVPTVANGLLAADYLSVTFTLVEGVLWSDGEPFTAADVRFTWQWVTDTANNSVSIGLFAGIADIEVVDDLTAKVTFSAPQPTWYTPFTSPETGVVYPKHILEGKPDAINAFATNPVGTGPYIVDTFAPDDEITFRINEHYREPTKPYFSRVIIKGGGDAASAARAVFQTHEYDYGWNLAIEPEVLRSIVEGSTAKLIVNPSTNTERLHFNFSDPNTEVDGQRSEVHTPHPYLSDPVVRQAISLAVDRDTIANRLYLGGDQEPADANVLAGVPRLASPNNPVVFDPDQARQLLDDAGWVEDGGVRGKDGVTLRAEYVSPVDAVRQRIQAIIKDNLENIGFEVLLDAIPPNVFFDVSNPDNDQSVTKFYADFLELASGAEGPHPSGFMQQWYAGPDLGNIPQASNDWMAVNFQRYVNPEYDALLEAVTVEPDPVRAAEMFIELNDIVVQNNVVVALVNTSDKNGAAGWLNEANLAPGPFSNPYWNIVNWNRVDEG